MPIPPKNLNEFSSLVQLITDLRGPEGCPWDKEQTHQTLTPYAIEETFEMVEALESGNDQDMCEELGDVLFQVVLHAELARERKAFEIQDVIKSISEKLVRRHPHVFANTPVSGMDEIFKNWDLIKAEEKKNKKQKTNTFNIPKGLPALQAADKIGEKTAKIQFDWTEIKDVLKQLKSEISELEDVIENHESNHEKLAHEMGDVLFSAAQVSRHLQLEPESVLRSANQRFTKRFEFMLSKCQNDMDVFKNLPPDDKEKLWKLAKEDEVL